MKYKEIHKRIMAARQKALDEYDRDRYDAPDKPLKLQLHLPADIVKELRTKDMMVNPEQDYMIEGMIVAHKDADELFVEIITE